jgi:hypothetical protein
MIASGNAGQTVAVTEKGRVPDATRTPASAKPGGPTSTQPLLALQRTIGNTAVIQMLRRPRVQRVAGHDVLRSGARLKVSDPAGRFERKPEANVRRAMRAPVQRARGGGPLPGSLASGVVRRGLAPVQRAPAPAPAEPAERSGAAQQTGHGSSAEAGAAGFDKASALGNIAVRGRYEAYAAPGLFADAVARLGSVGAAITLEQGEPVTVNDRELRRVLPVYTQVSVVPTGFNRAHEPVAGETPQERASKLDAYQSSLQLPPKAVEISRFLADVTKAYTTKKRGDVQEWRNRAMKYGQEVMGAARALGHPLFQKMANGFELKAIYEFMSFLTRWYGQQLAEIQTQEQKPDQLLLTLPNDCQAAAAQLLAAQGNTLGQVRERPEVGENYYIAFDRKADYGWNNHFAAVIMRDGEDTLTYETAANSLAVTERGKSLGYFAMYGASGTDRSFAEIITKENEKYAAEQQRNGRS